MENIIKTQEMTKEEWLKARTKGIGGSDVAAILGWNKYKTALDVYNEKTSSEIIETELTPKMKAGIMLEHVIAGWFEEETGLKVRKDNKIRIHKKYPFLIANIDRLIESNGDGPGSGVLEIKTTSGFIAKNWEDGDVPLTYYAQLQHYLGVTGFNYGYFAVLVDGYDLKLFRQERDDEYLDQVNERLANFWLNNVEQKVPPTPQSLAEITSSFPTATPAKEIKATNETLESLNQLIKIRSELKALEKLEEEKELEIKLAMQDSEILKDGERIVATWKNRTSSRFDSKQFSKDHADLYSNYLNQTNSRIFKVLGDK